MATLVLVVVAQVPLLLFQTGGMCHEFHEKAMRASIAEFALFEKKLRPDCVQMYCTIHPSTATFDAVTKIFRKVLPTTQIVQHKPFTSTTGMAEPNGK